MTLFVNRQTNESLDKFDPIGIEAKTQRHRVDLYPDPLSDEEKEEEKRFQVVR